MDNELLLFDRINIIRDVLKKNGEDNAYISFSGGKDSTVLHYLVDLALPDNKIPRLFLNTGIEYLDIVKFVKQMADEDERIIVHNAGVNIRKMLSEYGYPFKSKEYAKKLCQFQNNGRILTPYLEQYLNGTRPQKFSCPSILRYQWEDESFDIKISHLCCHKLKKDTAHQWAKDNKKSFFITGMKREEGGTRAEIQGCAIFKNGKLEKFHPLLPVSDEWEEWFIEKYNIKLCRLYYEPFNFERTGCKGCPFSLTLQEQLELMEKYLPNERKQCEIIWKPVYEEYRRIGYRLKKDEQLKLF